MMFDESVWIGKTLCELNQDTVISPLLNVGSSTKHFREVEQKCIHENIFAPLQQSGVVVHHLDMKKEPGVDIVGDLSDPTFLEQVRKSRYKSVLCSNLLEHVNNPEKICHAISEVVEPGGYIVVTVPNLYPYHGDPIDTMFRPGIEELKTFFPGTEVVKGHIMIIDNTHLRVLARNPKLLLTTVIRIFTPFYRFDNWRKIVGDIPNLTKKYKVTCLILRKSV